MWTPELNLKLLEILHDAVKIGGGGVVGGFFAWLVANHQTKSALERMRHERHARVLEEALARTDAIHHAFMKFYQDATGLVQIGPRVGNLKTNGGSSKTLGEMVLESHIGYGTASTSWIEVNTKLKILGETTALRAMQEFQVAIGDVATLWNGLAWKEPPETKAIPRMRLAYDVYCSEMQKAFARVSFKSSCDRKKGAS